MPVTFGSIGDIISLSLLIKDLAKSLDEGRGASPEYQAIRRELSSLEHALSRIEEVFGSINQASNTDALVQTANKCVGQCRECIARYQERIKKFEKSLQAGGSGNVIRDTSSKFRWQAFEKEDLPKFRVELHAHCMFINMLLTSAALQLSKSGEAELRARLERFELASSRSSAAQKTLLEEIQSMMGTAISGIKDLASRVNIDHLSKFGADTISSLQMLWRINVMTYNAVLKLQARVPAQLNRCWTQDPVIFDDALGRITPFHLEFIESWEVFDAVLEARFRQCPGHGKVMRKEYNLHLDYQDKELERSGDLRRCFFPGQRVAMSMIFRPIVRPRPIVWPRHIHKWCLNSAYQRGILWSIVQCIDCGYEIRADDFYCIPGPSHTTWRKMAFDPGALYSKEVDDPTQFRWVTIFRPIVIERCMPPPGTQFYLESRG